MGASNVDKEREGEESIEAEGGRSKEEEEEEEERGSIDERLLNDDESDGVLAADNDGDDVCGVEYDEFAVVVDADPLADAELNGSFCMS